MTYERTRYQGREFTATLQAPDEKTLNEMIEEMQEYAKQFDMGDVKILQKGIDPDGGYRAVVVAHNFNPFRWIKRKLEMRKAKNYAEKVQIKAMWKKEDREREVENKLKQKEKMQEKKGKLQYKAELAEIKEREERAKASRRALRGSSRIGSTYVYSGAGITGRKPTRITQHSPRLSKRKPLRLR